MLYNKKIFQRCFDYHGKYWYKNLKYIPLYFRLLHYLVKHGYDEYATWDMYYWFISVMKDVLKEYRDTHHGYPVISFDDKKMQQASEMAFDADLDKMVSLLDDMDEGNPKYDDEDYMGVYHKMEDAKNEFFQLFSKYFYNLWD